ncbi:MAG: AAA family ATPase [Myxococcaceae bacterium]
MRIDRLRIDGFGHFRNFDLELKPGLNVLYGPNEAGKSTLLAFMRAVLFGFEKRADPQRYENEDGPYGGELQLTTAQGPLRVRRMGGGKRKFEGELIVKDGQGELLGEGRLKEALFQVNKTLFKEVFAFSLSELQSLEAFVEQKDLSEAIFAAGTQGAHRLPEALAALRQSTSDLYTPGGKTRALNQVLAQLHDVRDRLEQLGNRPEAYFAARARLEELGALESKLQAELDGRTLKRDRLRRLVSVGQPLQELRLVRAELSALPDFSSFPEGASARLETLSAALERARSVKVGREQELAACERALKLASDDKLAEDQERRLRSAADAFNARCAQYQALPGRQQTLSARRRQVESDLQNLGLSLDGAALAEADFSTAARATLSAIRDRLALADRAVQAQDERHRAAKAKTAQVEEQVRRLSGESDRLPRAQPNAVRRAQAALSRLSVLAEQAAALEASQKEREAQVRGLKAQTEPSPMAAVPGWLVGAGMGVLVLACAGALAMGGGRALGIAAAASVSLAVLLVVVQRRASAAFDQALDAHAVRLKFRTQELARLTAEATALQARLAAVRQELSAAAAEASLSPNATIAERDARAEALSEELRAVERRVELSRELEGLGAQLAQVRRDETNAFADRNVADARRSQILRELEGFGAPRGFPRDLTADHALYLFSEAANLKARLFELRAEEQGLSADGEACDAVVGVLLAAAAEVGLPAAAPEASAAAVLELVERAREGRKDRSRLSQEREQLRSQLAAATTAESDARAQLQRLFELGGCEDAEALRARDQKARQWRELSRTARERTLQIESAAALNVAAVEAALVDEGGLAAAELALKAAEDAISGMAAELKVLREERGERRLTLTQWEKDDAAAKLREEEELLSARALDLVHRYAVERVALALLEKSRARFEKDAQPRVVQLASRLFEGLTGGKYVRAWLPAERPGELWVTSGDGKDRAAAQLSRGTREQLYLAFRLAVIEEFAQSRGPLPIIVDDILVNFDEQRTRNTLAVFARLAREHQFVAFTCHDSLRAMFAEHGAHVVEVQPRAQRTLFDVKAG